MKTGSVRIILADEHRLFIDSLKIIIERMTPQIRVVNTAQNSLDALKKTVKEQPDIILLDINLPGMEGLEMVRLIRNKSPETKIVILTANGEFQCIQESLKIGVSAYLLKDMALSDLITLLPLISDKTTVLSRELIPIIFDHTACRLHEHRNPADTHSTPIALSRQEKKLLDLIIRGFSNREIAEEMYLAEQTVKNYISTIYTKLGVRKRSQAIELGKSII